jgi:hypothetical protein
MGDSERRRAFESKRIRRALIAGDEFWGMLEDAEREHFLEERNKHHNEHVMLRKKHESERHFLERKKEEEGRH